MDDINNKAKEYIKNGYFAAKDAEDTAGVLMEKVQAWNNSLLANGWMNKLRDSWLAYYGAYFTNAQGNAHRITFAGEQGEIAQVAVNHLRNLAQHMLNMTTANRPALEARAANTDYKSLAQVNLANGLLDYYMREKRLERYIRSAVESAIVLSAGYVCMEWDANAGKLVDEDEETGLKLYEGDIKFSNLSPFDIMFDLSKEDSGHDWIVTRGFKNKYDLAAKYPEFADKIVQLSTKDEIMKLSMRAFTQMQTDDIPIYTLYHNKTDSMPDGRQLVFLDDQLILIDQPLPYRKIPVYRITPNEIMGTPFGYASVFDILPLQEVSNTLYTQIFSNQNALGMQNLFVEQGANLNFTNLAGGLNIIEGAKKPEPLNLLNTSPETFQFLQLIEKSMETISGINAVMRGNPEPNMRSANAMALVQSLAIQFMSGLQQQYVALLEDVGTGLIEILQDYANTERVASIVGKSSRTYLKEFKGADLSEIKRVVVDVANPLARTTAGRIEMAEQLMQMKAEDFTIEQYLQVINTGQLRVMTDDNTREQLLIQEENERLMVGENVRALVIDEHLQHIKAHRAVLNDPDFRKPEYEDVQRVVLNHIQEHIDFLRQTDPAFLNILGQQSLPPAPGEGAPTQEPGPTAPENSAAPELAQAPQQPNPADVSNIPSPPQPFNEMPVTPQQNLANITGQGNEEE
jgi:hypothetical protein